MRCHSGTIYVWTEYKKDGGNFVKKKVNSGSGLKVIPLGGLEQIGMNITAFEYEPVCTISFSYYDC